MSGSSGEAIVVCEPPASAGTGACLDLLTRRDGQANVLSVLTDESVDERADRLGRHTEAISGAAFVAVDPTASPSTSCRGAVRTVSSPADLTGIGVAVTDWLGARTGDENPSVCIDGVSTLLQYTDRERVFHLLHVVVGKCREQGAHVHVHLTPSAHDDQTVATLRQLFDDQRHVRSPPSTGTDASGVGGSRADAAPNPSD